MKPEDFTFHYYTSDDGIYLSCERCKRTEWSYTWEVNLGWEPTIDDAINAAEAHTCDS